MMTTRCVVMGVSLYSVLVGYGYFQEGVTVESAWLRRIPKMDYGAVTCIAS